MGTGVSPKRIATGNFLLSCCSPALFTRKFDSLGSPFAFRLGFPKFLRTKLALTSGFAFCSPSLSALLVITQQWNIFYSISLERRWSSRTFRYGYLVTTSPQLSGLPSTAPSFRLGHRLRAFPTPMVWRAVCTRPGNVFTAAFWSAITSDSSFV